MLYYLGNARSKEQYIEMVQLEKDGICIFCPEHVTKEGKKFIILSNDNWVLVKNDYPYPGTKYHYLMLPKDHVSMMTELEPSAQSDFWELLDQAVHMFTLTYWGLASRNGDPMYTGATIRHLHFHLIVADPDHKGPAVAVYLSSVPSDNPPPT